jgi:hypothetical protein
VSLRLHYAATVQLDPTQRSGLRGTRVRAIITLLIFLLIMNALAIFLRKNLNVAGSGMEGPNPMTNIKISAKALLSGQSSNHAIKDVDVRRTRP